MSVNARSSSAAFLVTRPPRAPEAEAHRADVPARRPHLMPHGDFSDMAAVVCLATGIASIFAPYELFYLGLGPYSGDLQFLNGTVLKPMFDSPATPEALALIRFAGGLLMFMGVVLYTVRWNKINGKAGATGCWIAAANAAHIALSMDDYVFVLRGWYLFSTFLVLAGLHLAFNANPMLTSAILREREKARAARKGKAN